MSTETTRDVDDATYRRILNFLYDEAELFDQHAYARWLERVTPDIRYRMPGRGFYEGQAPNPAFQNGYFDDDYATLAVRIELWSRPSTTTAESPPTITRHFVTNVRAHLGEKPGSFRVSSQVLVFRVRPTQREPYLFSGRRDDVLREEGGQLRLARRDVLMDEVVLMSPNLSFLV
jgi:3-phenylpropionate/cinnamic acid dioxygenase small subunit